MGKIRSGWSRHFPDNRATLKTPARSAKAVIHLREKGEIEDSPRDIGKLMKEVPADIKQEFEGEIKQKLFDHAWPKIARMVADGLPEWYKTERLNNSLNLSRGGERPRDND